MKELFSRDPGPGTYSATTAADSVMGASTTSNSTQGFGSGFISKQERFKKMPMEYVVDPMI
jgi:hypothetical protein